MEPRDTDLTDPEFFARHDPHPVFKQLRAVRDGEIRGRRIRERDWVVLWNSSANRDEEVFPDSDRFDAARKPNYHIAFGFGGISASARTWRGWN
jgi:cytochrome P450